jgi:hypothetical protein
MKRPEFRRPEPTDLYWAAITLFPHLPHQGLDEDARIRRAIQVARSFWNQAHADVQDRWCDEVILPLLRESSARSAYLKKLMEPAGEKDESTAQGYLETRHNMIYKTVRGLREQLIRAEIPFRVLYSPFITESECEYVLTSDLDKFAEMPRAKERERKRATRGKKGRQENPLRNNAEKT